MFSTCGETQRVEVFGQYLFSYSYVYLAIHEGGLPPESTSWPRHCLHFLPPPLARSLGFLETTYLEPVEPCLFLPRRKHQARFCVVL